MGDSMRYAKIDELEYINGNGVGVSLYTQGCAFHCKDCFNQETWDFNSGKEWTTEVEEKFLKLIDKSYITRISILGGSPLADKNVYGVCDILHKIKDKYPEKKIWLYTGYVFEDIIKEFNIYKWTPFSAGAGEWLTRYEVLTCCDVLVDGCFETDKKDLTLKFRGSSNQRIINAQKSIEEGKVILWDYD